eukprot:GHVU01034785.1.p2 GENE.GHVU01034785.1~~GHVU01034785.1.p2  ORF type:complete len:110 (-),score=8.65 GHVU01034785.1:63-392(-)
MTSSKVESNNNNRRESVSSSLGVSQMGSDGDFGRSDFEGVRDRTPVGGGRSPSGAAGVATRAQAGGRSEQLPPRCGGESTRARTNVCGGGRRSRAATAALSPSGSRVAC